MARKKSIAHKPKTPTLENESLHSEPRNSPASDPPVDDDADKNVSSATKGDLDKPNTSKTTKQHAESITSAPLPPSSTCRRSKRKQTTEKSTSKSPSDTPLMKKPRPSKGYAPPSTYAHLNGLTDTITPNLLCLFIGLNPGIQTATLGHPYAHPSNHFWRLLHSSGLTPHRQLAPAEYVILPKEYDLGNTNIVDRATRNGGELSKDEMVAGAGVLDKKIRKSRPEVVCLVGKSIWEAVWKWKYGKAMKAHQFKYGFQDTTENMGKSGGFGETETPWPGARVFVATSTSGLAATLSMQQKQEIWRELGEWVEKRREERKSVKNEGADKSTLL
ncbi:uracil-DNA glycosylase-like protein [Tricladium varicosporioides]|nr:uracil-DNA glycosylase-like protein [Hymenoscyphus varicosporioides]